MPFVRRIRFRIPIPIPIRIRIQIQILSGLVWPFDVSSVDRWRSFQLNANLNEGFFLLHTFFLFFFFCFGRRVIVAFSRGVWNRFQSREMLFTRRCILFSGKPSRFSPSTLEQ